MKFIDQKGNNNRTGISERKKIALRVKNEDTYKNYPLCMNL